MKKKIEEVELVELVEEKEVSPKEEYKNSDQKEMEEYLASQK